MSGWVGRGRQDTAAGEAVDGSGVVCFNGCMSEITETYRGFVKTLKEISLLDPPRAILGWDERTQMPSKGAGLRADQASLIAQDGA